MNVIIMNNNKQFLLSHIGFLNSKTNIINCSNTAINFCCEVLRPLYSSWYIHLSERSFKTFENCNYLLKPNISKDHYRLSTNNPSRINYSSLLLAHPKHQRIQESQKRFKSKKRSKGPEYDSDSDEEKNNDEGESKSTKPVTLKVQSLRLDGLLKKALGIARNKVETIFYAGGLRVNGIKPSKKSYQVQIGDEVDLIKGISPLNPEFLLISRVEILSVKEDSEEEGQLIVKLRRSKTMYVENYERDPWKKSSSE